MDPRPSPAPTRLAALRAAMQAEGVHAVLVPSADPHLSEYLPEHWQGREWLSGFTGSMATLIVTAQHAWLLADSRYWDQAERELTGSGIALEKVPSGAPSFLLDALTRALRPGEVLAVDGRALSLSLAAALHQAAQAHGHRLRTDVDLLGRIWPDRPALPGSLLREHAPPHATTSRSHKFTQVRDALAAHGATHHLISSLDDVAWLTNLRGSDVRYNPVFLAHLLLSPDSVTLFAAPGSVSASLQERLHEDGIEVTPYDEATSRLAALPAQAVLLLDPRRTTLALRDAVPKPVRVVEAINPSTLLKSRKSDADAAFVREAMVEDGAAMCAFYARFEQALARGEALTELTVDEWLSAERARRPGFQGLSFPTIAGFNANGALPHYRALPEAHARIEGNGLLLIDSGGQYLGGTTDITRMWAIGQVSDAQKRDVTRVLQGMIALSRAIFPVGTPGPMLDALARAPLWAHGLDYGHGTGHGVGYYLNVHEGPQSISKATPEPAMAMQPGMITSNEPGLYRPGQWGVRIENLVLTVPHDTPEAGAFGAMLAFETLTLCPIDTTCLDPMLLSESERDWLNAYHATVRERLLPHVSGDARDWLLRRTEQV